MWQYLVIAWQWLLSHPWLFRITEILLINFVVGLGFWLWYFVITKKMSSDKSHFDLGYDSDFITDSIIDAFEWLLTVNCWWYWMSFYILFNGTERLWEFEVRTKKEEIEKKYGLKILIASPKSPRGAERRLMITCPKCQNQYSYYGYGGKCTSCGNQITFTGEERSTLGEYHYHFPTELFVTT